jgi:hypothetical protein
VEVVAWDRLPAQLSWKEKIAYLFVSLAQAMPDHTPLPVEHVIGNGAYIRKMRLPADMIFLGREHLQGHQVSLMKGSAILITPAGKKRYDAPASLITDPGFHTVAYMLTECEVWTLHGNPQNLTDTQILEDQIFGSVDSMRDLGIKVTARLALEAA